jgi:hypothetical protein
MNPKPTGCNPWAFFVPSPAKATASRGDRNNSDRTPRVFGWVAEAGLSGLFTNCLSRPSPGVRLGRPRFTRIEFVDPL